MVENILVFVFVMNVVIVRSMMVGCMLSMVSGIVKVVMLIIL